MPKKRTTLHSFSLLTGITVFEKIVAFVFEAVIAAFIGTSIISDGYFASAGLFNLIDSAFLSAITVVALNRYAYYVNNEGEIRGFEVLSDLQSFYLPLMLLLSVLIFALARPLSFVVAPGYGDEARAVVVRCIRILSFTPTVICITSIGIAVLRQKKRFEITCLKSLFISVVGIVSVLIFGRRELKNADVLSGAYAVSMVSYCILVFIFAGQYGKIRIHKPTINPELKKSLKMLFPLMVSYGVGRIALMVDSIIASTLKEGSVSALTYAHSLYRVVAAIFVTNLCTIILTDFNNLCARNESDKVEEEMRKTISIMTLILIPIMIVTIFNSNEIVKIVYERGKFSSDATATVGGVLLFYALNFVPVMIQGIYNQALYAFGDTMKPMLIAVLSVVLNLGTSIPLTLVIGLPGVAIGTVISTIGAVICGRIVLRKYLPHYKGCYSLKFIWKAAISTAVCLAVVFLVSKAIHNHLMSFVVSTVVAFAAFLGCLFIFREEITVSYTKSLLNKIRKKKA